MNFEFSTESVEAIYSGESSRFSLGFHEVKIKSADIKETKHGTGRYVVIEVENKEKQTGRMFFNVENQNKKAQEIGRGQFAALLNEIKIKKLSDLSTIIGKKLFVNVTPDRANLSKGYILISVCKASVASEALSKDSYVRPEYPEVKESKEDSFVLDMNEDSKDNDNDDDDDFF